MNFFKWLTQGRSVRSVVMSSYKRGLSRAGKNNPTGAMEDFTAVINTRDAPEDVKAMALYNRALIYTATNQTSKAMADLNAVMAMPEPLREIKSAARKRLDRVRHQQDIMNGSGIHTRRPT